MLPGPYDTAYANWRNTRVLIALTVSLIRVRYNLANSLEILAFQTALRRFLHTFRGVEVNINISKQWDPKLHK